MFRQSKHTHTAILLMLLIVLASCRGESRVQASDSTSTKVNTVNGVSSDMDMHVFVVTEIAPVYVLDYAKENGYNTINGLVNLSSEEHSGELELGMPICVQVENGDVIVYHFPVMRNQKIIGIYSLMEQDGDLLEQFEQNQMATVLETLKGRTSQQMPLYLVNTEDGLFGVLDLDVMPLSPDSILRDKQKLLSAPSMDGDVVDITQVLDSR